MKETALADFKQHMSTRVEEMGGEKDRVKFTTAQAICKKHLCPTLSHMLYETTG